MIEGMFPANTGFDALGCGEAGKFAAIAAALTALVNGLRVDSHKVFPQAIRGAA